MKKTVVLIMAGGIGSRFWPASRTSVPKQFVDVLGIGKSLLQLTYERFLGIVDQNDIYIVSGPIYTKLIAQQLPELPEENILIEPARKNTAPALAFSCIKIQHKYPDANVIVAPADHLILKQDAFKALILEGLDFVGANPNLLTLGITPTQAHTGYGYIQYRLSNDNDSIKSVDAFVEKPDAETAATYLSAGNYLWNAGIFLWNVNTFLEALQVYAPLVYHAFDAYQAAIGTDVEAVTLEEGFNSVPDISIDYAIMETASNVFTLPADIGWSDLGAWNALHEVSEKEADGSQNVLIGASHVVLDGTSDCLIKAPGDKLVVIKGLEDYLVIDERDVLMIYPRREEQAIKQVRKYLEDNRYFDYL